MTDSNEYDTVVNADGAIFHEPLEVPQHDTIDSILTINQTYV